jgi:GRAM domain-containing protein
MKVNLKPNEVVVKASDTSHLTTEDSIKGKLILTNQRIYFKTQDLEQDEFNLELMPADISEVMVFNTFKFFSNGLSLLTKDGRELKFTIKKRDDWCRSINCMN